MHIIIVIIVFSAIYFAINKIYFNYWDKRLDVKVEFSTASAFEDEKIFLIETISNRKWLPIPWLSLKFGVSRKLKFMDESYERGGAVTSDFYYRNDLFSVLMKHKIVRKIPCECKRRGFYVIDKLDLLSSGAFGGGKYITSTANSGCLSVYPKPIKFEDFPAPFRKLTGNVIARKYLYPDPFEFRGIREYELIDSLKSVNFAASAKCGALMTNVYNHTVSQEIVIILNLQQYRRWSDSTVFEYAIRMAAALASRFLEESVAVSLMSNGTDVVTGIEVGVESGSGANHMERIYHVLSRMEYDGVAVSVVDMLEIVEQSYEREPLYIIISTYCDSDLVDKFKEMRRNFFDMLWLVPTTEEDSELLKINELLCDEIIECEVEFNG